MKSKEVTIILPIHSVKGDTMEWFKKALNSVEAQQVKPEEVLVVRCTCPDVKGEVENFIANANYTFPIRIIENALSKDFQTQINEAVKHVTTGYFSILELDDEYAVIWFKNVQEHISAYPDVGVFLPIIVETDAAGKFMATTNEAVWASNFSNILGFLDNDALLAFQNFNISGAVIKTELIHKFGGLKKNIRLTFVYEFLLRLTYNDVKIMTLPKFGYRHTNFRPNSHFHDLQNKENPDFINPDEAKFWIESAKKEFYWVKDREVAYKHD